MVVKKTNKPRTSGISKNQRTITAAPYFVAILSLVGIIIDVVLLLTQKGKAKWHATQALVVALILFIGSLLINGLISATAWGTVGAAMSSGNPYLTLTAMNSLMWVSWVYIGVTIVIYLVLGLKVLGGEDLRISFLEKATEAIANIV
jgi:hypothetical protein